MWKRTHSDHSGSHIRSRWARCLASSASTSFSLFGLGRAPGLEGLFPWSLFLGDSCDHRQEAFLNTDTLSSSKDRPMEAAGWPGSPVFSDCHQGGEPCSVSNNQNHHRLPPITARDTAGTRQAQGPASTGHQLAEILHHRVLAQSATTLLQGRVAAAAGEHGNPIHFPSHPSLRAAVLPSHEDQAQENPRQTQRGALGCVCLCWRQLLRESQGVDGNHSCHSHVLPDFISGSGYMVGGTGVTHWGPCPQGAGGDHCSQTLQGQLGIAGAHLGQSACSRKPPAPFCSRGSGPSPAGSLSQKSCNEMHM